VVSYFILSLLAKPPSEKNINIAKAAIIKFNKLKSWIVEF
jgi:hypothetical protein